ncbi:hypothetical protein M885DRAFT_618905 [Pelagophyceae sp. CCMP2097]|nr:hypothetical protein M885DRAFT_618905 [Pelagophyceae sp. CCMP2097]
MGPPRVFALVCALACVAAAWCPPPQAASTAMPPSGVALIAEIHGGRPRPGANMAFSPYLARFVWWHVAVMGFEHVHLLVFHNVSVPAPNAADVYGAQSCVNKWVASGALTWEVRPYYDWVAVLDVDEFLFANASAAPHGRGLREAPKVAPVLAAIEASLQRAPTAPGADVFSGVGSLCFPSYPFVNPGLRNLPVLRSAESDQYKFTAVAPDENGHAYCWKSMHRTKAVPRLETPYSMHIGPGHSRRALRKTGALAVAHLARGTPVPGTTADEYALVELAKHAAKETPTLLVDEKTRASPVRRAAAAVISQHVRMDVPDATVRAVEATPVQLHAETVQGFTCILMTFHSNKQKTFARVYATLHRVDERSARQIVGSCAAVLDRNAPEHIPAATRTVAIAHATFLKKPQYMDGFQDDPIVPTFIAANVAQEGVRNALSRPAADDGDTNATERQSSANAVEQQAQAVADSKSTPSGEALQSQLPLWIVIDNTTKLDAHLAANRNESRI